MIKNTLYAKYIKQRQNEEIIETDNGFIIYCINDKELYLADTFVDQSTKSPNEARTLLEKLILIAKENCCDCISANIHLWDKNASKTLAIALHFGFKVVRAENGIILIVKDLGVR